MDNFDTTTSKGLSDALRSMDMSPSLAAQILGTSVDTVRRWLKGNTPVHPTAAVMVDALLAGYVPPGSPITGEEMQAWRTGRNMSQDQLAIVLDVETIVVQNWEASPSGPPPFVAKFLTWIDNGVVISTDLVPADHPSE